MTTTKARKYENINQLCEDLIQEGYPITTYDTLIDFIKAQIDDGMIKLAIYFLYAVEKASDYYIYDYTMGIFDIPIAINTCSDLEHLLD